MPNAFIRTAPPEAWPDLGLPSVVLNIDGINFHDRLIETYTSMTDAVLDPMGGRGPNDMLVVMQREDEEPCEKIGEKPTDYGTPEFGVLFRRRQS